MHEHAYSWCLDMDKITIQQSKQHTPIFCWQLHIIQYVWISFHEIWGYAYPCTKRAACAEALVSTANVASPHVCFTHQHLSMFVRPQILYRIDVKCRYNPQQRGRLIMRIQTGSASRGLRAHHLTSPARHGRMQVMAFDSKQVRQRSKTENARTPKWQWQG